MSGSLHVHLDSAGLQDDAVVACEVIGGPKRTSQTMPVRAGETAVLDVPQGLYLVRAVLPSGEQLSSTTEVLTDQATSVTLAVPIKAPKDSGVDDLLSGVLPRALPIPSPAASGPDTRAGRRRLWIRLWRGGEVLPWRPDKVENLGGRMTAVLSQRPEAHAVQVCCEESAWRVACLPPTSEAVVTAAIDDVGAGFHDGVRVETSGRSGLTNAMLGYLTSGQLDKARVVAPELLAVARTMFQQKIESPEGAAVAGYFLLRVGEQELLGDWPNNFARWFDRLPDASVIHAWQLLRRPGVPDRRLARDRLMQAAESGVPRYTEGLRLLFEGLQTFAAEDPSDAEAARLLADVRRYAAACDWGSGHTTYWANSPDAPTLERLTGRPGEQVDWFEFDLAG